MRTFTLAIVICTLASLNVKGQEVSQSGRVSTSKRSYAEIHHPAEFPGGSEELGKYLARRLRYPASLQRAGVYPPPITVSFTVAETGAIQNVEVLKLSAAEYVRLAPYLVKVVNVVEKMPRWKPATIGNTAIASQHVIPVTIYVE